MIDDIEPEPIGIPNRIGNTCWFQSATQCIFRNPEFRRKINKFDPANLQIKNDQSTLECLKILHRHFNTLANSKDGLDVDNSQLVTTLKADNHHLVTAQTSSGKDSYNALIAYHELFATLLGDSRFGFHSYNSPFGSIQTMKLSQPTPKSPPEIIHIIFCILEEPGDIRQSFLKQIDQLFFLPEVLVLRQDRSCKERTNPDPILSLPEPFDFIAAGKVLEKCKTETKYELYGMVCYQGQNADHAIAEVKLVGKNAWYEFNDQKVERKGDDSILKDGQTLTPNFNWPALLFYRKLK
ncbi:hypothetical protein TRFO_32353 [Tritrichomonas foetus]|uniref:USP domain-containing protein n=1 Tax=Tritrichomonas foetus TaxID=1144522 RepID=A0A1J4JR41_9EUKA|nr:hypothetical protein TRFO_32353 [Tritrichomonas foetus]|eukprot:OHT00880.1 hypothetical protein TRFO_32353 [Tritrichomonas foetus]